MGLGYGVGKHSLYFRYICIYYNTREIQINEKLRPSGIYPASFFFFVKFLKKLNERISFLQIYIFLQELVFVPLIFFFFSLESITLVRSKMILSQRLAKRFELIAALFLLRYAISIYGLYNKEYGLPL